MSLPKSIFSITKDTNFDKKFQQIRKHSVVTLGKAAREEFSYLINDKSATRNRIIQAGEKEGNSLEVGSMFFYVYDAKTKDKLPYWDKFPLTIPIEIHEKGWLGLNLHYLHPTLRVKLLGALFPYKSTKTLVKSSELRVSYEIVHSFTKGYWDLVQPCLKQYLFTQLRSKPYKVDPREWLSAVFLPFENFQKQNKSYVYRQVFK